ncbi:histidine phosphatase family protein [Puteibacter caeruleilacunae]|nr:histidine phosphatase family protein [Puteibacter caeruleilacunae]
MAEIYLIRHGETDYNKHNSIVGGRSSHISINQTGIEQSQKLGEWIKNNLSVDAVYCSTSNRARQTLKEVFKGEIYANVTLSENLEELSQGEWEGQPRDKIYTPEQIKIIKSDNYRFKAPGGESQEEVENRMFLILEEIIAEHTDETVVIISHGIALKCLLRKILDSSPAMTSKISLANCSISKLRYSDENGWEIRFINRVI